MSDEIECQNANCNHGKGENAGAHSIICFKCGLKPPDGRKKWLCKMCYLSAVNDAGENDFEVEDMDVDPNENRISIVGRIKIEN